LSQFTASFLILDERALTINKNSSPNAKVAAPFDDDQDDHEGSKAAVEKEGIAGQVVVVEVGMDVQWRHVNGVFLVLKLG
jgi:hypothetical protein